MLKPSLPFRCLTLCGLAAALLASPLATAQAKPSHEWVVATNVYNFHYRPDPKHWRISPLIGLEWRHNSGWLVGGAAFMNSFGQFSQLAYGGYLYEFGRSGLYGKVVAGVIHGYRGAHRRAIPYNHGGFAPGLIPALGYKAGPLRLEAQFIWTNGMMFTAGYAF